jgi:Flp pilus assembly protein TadD
MDEAEEYLEKSARLSLGDPEIFENLGDLYGATARPTEAIAEYRRALAWPTTEPDARARVQAKIAELEKLPPAPDAASTTATSAAAPATPATP